MTDQTQVATPCPACSASEPTVHEVLSPGTTATVRCTECDHVHKTQIEQEETTELPVIVSQDGDSFSTRVEAPTNEEIAAGEEFIVDTEEAIMTVRITSLELGDEQRTKRATVSNVSTIWTRAVDNVNVSITLNPTDGRHDETRSLTALVPGDHEFTVGKHTELADEEFTVKSIKLRDDVYAYEFEQLDHEGDTAAAKDIKRVYADDESNSAWSAW